MKIEVVKNRETTKFSDVPGGFVFEYGTNYYIKLTGLDKTHAVRLANGSTARFENHQLVYVINNATLVVEE